MNRTLRIASAASIALGAAKSGPGDDGVDMALLDLRDAPKELAKSKLKTILGALGPKLFLQGELRLLVAVGELDTQESAMEIAAQLDSTVRGSTLISIVHGEKLTDRIEEFTRTGYDLVDTRTGRRLIDETPAPKVAWSPASAAPIAKALGENARIVVSNWADPGTQGIAGAINTFNWTINDLQRIAAAACAARLASSHKNDNHTITLGEEGTITPQLPGIACQDAAQLPDVHYTTGEPVGGPTISYPQWETSAPPAMADVHSLLPTGGEMIALLRVQSGITRQEDFLEVLRSLSGVEQLSTASWEMASDQHLAIQLRGDNLETLRLVAQQIELLSSEFGAKLDSPLTNQIRSTFRTVHSSLPRELLEFGHKTRSAADWLE